MTDQTASPAMLQKTHLSVSSEKSLAMWLELLPQCPPMRLLTGVNALSVTEAQTIVGLSSASLFYIPNLGVPASTSLEYIGQTAALIGLYARSLADAEQRSEPNALTEEGFLLASRSMRFTRAWFQPGEQLVVSARQIGDVGATLATFEGTVDSADGERLASGKLSVWRGDPEQNRSEGGAVPAP